MHKEKITHCDFFLNLSNDISAKGFLIQNQYLQQPFESKE